MGEMADYHTERGIDILADHLAGHPAFDPTFCPYCEEESEADDGNE